MSDITRSIGDLMRERGNIAARRAAGQGQIWGRALENIGQTIASVPAQIQQRQAQGQMNEMRVLELESARADAARRKKAEGDVSAIDEAMAAGGLDRNAITKRLIETGRGHLVPTLQKTWMDADKYSADATKAKQEAEDRNNDYFAALASGVKALGADAEAFDIALKHAESKGYDTTQERALLAQNPEKLAGVLDALIARSPKFAPKDKPSDDFTLGPGNVRFDKSGKQIASVPAAEKVSAETRSLDVQAADALARGDTATYQRLLKVKKEMGQADDRPRITVQTGGTQEDAEAIADAIIRGDQPPEMTGLYRMGGPVRGALAKKGYNQASALTDWRATQKHVSTLNGAQQTRMAQAIDNAAHSLDVIDTLADQWNAGRFPILNRVTLKAAKGGALGKDAQQIATQLEAQISDVTSELGNVYMGGNSPTDHALTLAAKNLSADWNKEQLKSALNLARQNLTIRANSMKNVGVSGASATNPYAAPPAPPPIAEEWVRDAKGKLVKKGGK